MKRSSIRRVTKEILGNEISVFRLTNKTKQNKTEGLVIFRTGEVMEMGISPWVEEKLIKPSFRTI